MFFKRGKYTKLRVDKKRIEIPDSLCVVCPQCSEMLLDIDLKNNMKVCPLCDYHFKMNAKERIEITFDKDSFVEYDANLHTENPLDFVDSKPYPKRIEEAKAKSGLNEAIITGMAKIGGYEVNTGIMDFNFIGGSMGSVVGEKVTRVFERAMENKKPVIMFITSGGARMQEGILSLMQMAKTSAAVARLEEKKIPYITVLTNPSMAGVMASYGSLGDITIAEPEALIGFAGPRVIKQTINQVLPKGFQTSEFLLEHGFIDIVVHRKILRPTLLKLLKIISKKS